MRSVALAAMALLGGCVSAENSQKAAEARIDAGMRPERVRLTAAQVREIFVHRTRVTSAGALGSQISYMSPDGTAYLWFPGNQVVVSGRWSIEESGGYRPYAGRPVSEVSVCFEYGPNTVNAFTGRRSGKECASAEARAGLIQDSASGDVFGLSRSGTAPFVLPRERTTIAQLRARLPRG